MTEVSCIKHFFDPRTVKEPSFETLLRVAELALTLNCFSFGGNYYKQTIGVATGTKIRPSYANLLIGFIEHQFFSRLRSLHWRLHRRNVFYQRETHSISNRRQLPLPGSEIYLGYFRHFLAFLESKFQLKVTVYVLVFTRLQT